MAKGNTKLKLKLVTMGPSRWDGLLLFLLLLITLYLERGVPPHQRPVDLTDPSLHLPHKNDLVTDRNLILCSLIGPLGVFVLFELRGLRNKRALALLFFTGLLEATVPTVLITNILKLVIGRPRPYFASVCVGYVPGSEIECTGDAHAVEEARKSFPSGHSSLAFSAAVFLACYLAAKLGFGKATGSARTWKTCVVLAPPFVAALVAASRTVDYHHHYADIVAGAVLGTAVAMTAFNGRSAGLAKLAEMEEMDEVVFDGAGYETIAGEEGV